MWNPFSFTVSASAALFGPPAALSPLADRRRYIRANEVRRRPDKMQARALEVLAHALEYLVDSSVQAGRPASAGTMEAVELLAKKSRAVFAECPEIVSFSRRLMRRLPPILTLPPVEDPSVLSRIHRSSGETPRVSRGNE